MKMLERAKKQIQNGKSNEKMKSKKNACSVKVFLGNKDKF
uniref:Uncharacterized protein n=1 Tax=Tetranychus urticae TaxID=32264 RepID=T1KBB7_TETUR